MIAGNVSSRILPKHTCRFNVHRPYSLGLHDMCQVPHCCLSSLRQGEHMWIEIGIFTSIALLQRRWPNGGGTPTTQTCQSSNGIRYTISTCSNQLLLIIQQSIHFQQQPHSLLTTLLRLLVNQLNQQNGLLQVSPHRLRGRLRLRRTPGWRC